MRKSNDDWTPEVIARLWDHHAEQDQKTYFSFQSGRGITHFLEMTGHLKGEVLDYGCGPGFLLDHLLAKGLSCTAIEFSADSVEFVNRRFSGLPNWKSASLVSGLPSPLLAQSFDVITCVEVVEHLSDELLKPVLNELHRLVKPGGIVLITTPNEERLDENLSYCPFCDSEFHRYGHLRTFNATSLQQLLSECGLETSFCQGIAFPAFQNDPAHDRFVPLPGIVDWSPRLLYRRVASLATRWQDVRNPRTFPQSKEFKRRAVRGPHLCVVAHRKQ